MKTWLVLLIVLFSASDVFAISIYPRPRDFGPGILIVIGVYVAWFWLADKLSVKIKNSVPDIILAVVIPNAIVIALIGGLVCLLKR
jgi:lipopolysaccharide export LptBFGC system permease protein LptF